MRDQAMVVQSLIMDKQQLKQPVTEYVCFVQQNKWVATRARKWEGGRLTRPHGLIL